MKCFFKGHKYEILHEYVLNFGTIIGFLHVCLNCAKLDMILHPYYMIREV